VTDATSTLTDARPYTSVWSDLAQTEFSQGYLQAGPYRTRYLHAGSDDKPVLLLLHGITGHAEAYVRNLAAHAEHFNVYAIDFIGHGYSTKPDHPLEIPHYIDQLNHVLDTLGADKAYLSGESLGGWTTAKFAQTYPERVERIALNTMGGTMANAKVMERLYTLSMEAAKDPSWERVKARLEWLMADPTMVTDDLIRTRQAIFQQPNWLTACEMNMALQDLETRTRNMLSDDDLGAIQAEALVIWTTKDPSGPVDEGERIAGLIPNARLAVMENCGHWPQYEDPSTFNRLHLDFLLNGHAGEAAATTRVGGAA
jgi:2-hydroxy-6-oxonona-2,4-dienedioate hydrolase